MNSTTYSKLRTFYLLWSTQGLSQLGSTMTNFALTLWLYQKTGSALQTALLAICSYTPYVLMSIFAGALSDRWDKKRVMLISDACAAATTVLVLVLVLLNLLLPVHLYILSAVNGLMNTIQRPASDVAMTLIVPKEEYQKTSGLRYFSNSLVTILHPVLATAVFAFAGIFGVILIDLGTFIVAFCALLFLIKLPNITHHDSESSGKESLLASSREGLRYLKHNPMILYLILFLAGVNLVASAFDAALPAYILPRANGGQKILGLVLSFAGISTLLGSLAVTVLPTPKNRIRVIVGTMLFSLTIENFLLALTNEPVLWCLGQILGWFVVPIMGANLDVILRTTIPVAMQGRVYSCRNSLQFFTIPVGHFLGGFLIDTFFEPLVAANQGNRLLTTLFGSAKGSGAGMMIFSLGLAGACVCLFFGRLLKKYRFVEQIETPRQ